MLVSLGYVYVFTFQVLFGKNDCIYILCEVILPLLVPLHRALVGLSERNELVRLLAFLFIQPFADWSRRDGCLYGERKSEKR